MIDFSPLWETLEKKGISQYQLIQNGVDRKTLDSLRKNRNVTLLTIEKLVKILECEIQDIVKFID